ncbi:hypothetical protein INT48_003356 [Thamnidium elegans]|uniref:Uncharacterized protein n=1 Tax=Thamnidium elegans TaxID=101142 RepID=A0A8H7SNB3_9FUNG|nr:hypothetical protein INT48_003356 [Thamnidium elegans]
MEMDIDQEFDDFELGSEDLLALQQKEEIYLSSQQVRTTDTQLNLVPPIEHASTNEQPTHIPAIGRTSTKSQSLLEAEHTIENLRFRLHRSELTQANNDDEHRKRELEEAKSILKEKAYILRLRQELARLKEQDDVYQKRPFPGTIPDSQKQKRNVKPSPFLKPLSSFSQSQNSQQSQTQNTPQPMSMASPVKIPSSYSAPKKPKVLQPRKKSGLTETETEKNNKLLIVLFTPLFQQWNHQNHKNTKDINVCLTKVNIRYFSERFSQQLVPDRNQCSSAEHFNHLLLLASDISSHLIKSEYAHSTIRLLLNVLNLSLQICIKEKCFKVIQNIVSILTSLCTTFSITKKYLVKDLRFDNNSILFQLTKSFELFWFDKQEKYLLLDEVPDIQQKSMTDIIRLSETYSTTPTELLHRLKQANTPKESFTIVSNILELFYCVGSQDEKAVFDFLMEDSFFLRLLYPTTPYKVIIAALSVLETNFLDDVYMVSYKDQNLTLVNCLTNITIVPQGSFTFDQWFELRHKSMDLLYCMTLAQPSSILFAEIFKVIFQSTNLALAEVTREFNKHRPIASIKNRKQYDHLMKIGLEIMYSVIMNYPQDIFEHVSEPKPNHVLGYVQFFRI